jgi:hypothetical protein
MSRPKDELPLVGPLHAKPSGDNPRPPLGIKTASNGIGRTSFWVDLKPAEMVEATHLSGSPSTYLMCCQSNYCWDITGKLQNQEKNGLKAFR